MDEGINSNGLDEFNGCSPTPFDTLRYEVLAKLGGVLEGFELGFRRWGGQDVAHNQTVAINQDQHVGIPVLFRDSVTMSSQPLDLAVADTFNWLLSSETYPMRSSTSWRRCWSCRLDLVASSRSIVTSLNCWIKRPFSMRDVDSICSAYIIRSCRSRKALVSHDNER